MQPSTISHMLADRAQEPCPVTYLREVNSKIIVWYYFLITLCSLSYLTISSPFYEACPDFSEQMRSWDPTEEPGCMTLPLLPACPICDKEHLHQTKQKAWYYCVTSVCQCNALPSAFGLLIMIDNFTRQFLISLFVKLFYFRDCS